MKLKNKDKSLLRVSLFELGEELRIFPRRTHIIEKKERFVIHSLRDATREDLREGVEIAKQTLPEPHQLYIGLSIKAALKDKETSTIPAQQPQYPTQRLHLSGITFNKVVVYSPYVLENGMIIPRRNGPLAEDSILCQEMLWQGKVIRTQPIPSRVSTADGYTAEQLKYLGWPSLAASPRETWAKRVAELQDEHLSLPTLPNPEHIPNTKQQRTGARSRPGQASGQGIS